MTIAHVASAAPAKYPDLQGTRWPASAYLEIRGNIEVCSDLLAIKTSDAMSIESERACLQGEKRIGRSIVVQRVRVMLASESPVNTRAGEIHTISFLVNVGCSILVTVLLPVAYGNHSGWRPFRLELPSLLCSS